MKKPLARQRTSTVCIRRGYGEHRDSAKRSPGEGDAGRRKLPDRTQWVKWNPTRERLATPGSEFCVVVSDGGTKRKQPVLRPCDRAPKVTIVWCPRGSNLRGRNPSAAMDLARGTNRSPRARQRSARVRRELGRTEGVLGTKHRDQGATGRTTPRRRGGDFPAAASEHGNQPEVLRRNVTNGVTQDKPGSLSCLIVPLENRRTSPVEAWE